MGAYKNAVTEIGCWKEGIWQQKYIETGGRASAIAKRRLYCSRGVYCAYDIVEQKIEEENCIWSTLLQGRMSARLN